jgi:hypothetical protein
MWMMPLCAFAPNGKLGSLSSAGCAKGTGDTLGGSSDLSDVAVRPDHDTARQRPQNGLRVADEQADGR